MGYFKTELSDRNKWAISKHRYLELTHFCLQYPEWQRQLREIDILRNSVGERVDLDRNWSDPTSEIVIRRSLIFDRVEMVERVAREAERDLASYILLAVTKGLTYPQLSTCMDIPCGKDMFYDRRRKFFWLLDKERQ